MMHLIERPDVFPRKKRSADIVDAEMFLASQQPEKCWTHSTDTHHFFLSYRVEFEGKQSPHSMAVWCCCYKQLSYILKLIMLKEMRGGLAQLVYERLGVKKSNNGRPFLSFKTNIA